MKYALAYDLGTSSVKACVFDEYGHKIKSAVKPYNTFFSQGPDGLVYKEQRPEEWWKAICNVTAELSLYDNNLCDVLNNICGIGISGHSLGVAALGRDGNLVTEYMPIWSDSRAIAQANAFFEKFDYSKWYAITGNGFNPELYSLFKILWYKDNMPEVYENTAYYIGTKDYINFKMTGNIATDISYASGSGAFSLKDLKYDEKIIKTARVNPKIFACIKKSHEIIGTLTEAAAGELGIPKDIPVVAGGVDNACMSLGAGCFENNDVYASLGSSAWIAASSSKPEVDIENSLYVWAHCVDGMYLPSSGIYSSGTSREWVQNVLLGMSDMEDNYEYFDKLAKDAPVGANGVIFCPVLSGSAPVDVKSEAKYGMKGAIHGITLSTKKSDIARACLEGISMELNLALDALTSKIPISDTVTVVGGGAKSDICCQIYADVFNKNIEISDVGRDAAAFGAAALAFRGSGIWSDYKAVKSAFKQGSKYLPDKENVKKYNEIKNSFMEVCAHA